MATLSLGPLILFTPVFEECRHFYEAVLGTEPQSVHDGYAEYRLGSTVFALHRSDGPASPAGRLHLHFATSDLNGVLERATAAGFPPTATPVQQAWGREVHFTDPAGFGFEIVEMPGEEAV